MRIIKFPTFTPSIAIAGKAYIASIPNYFRICIYLNPHFFRVFRVFRGSYLSVFRGSASLHLVTESDIYD